jgi:hypothetical protein
MKLPLSSRSAKLSSRMRKLVWLIKLLLLSRPLLPTMLRSLEKLRLPQLLRKPQMLLPY